MLFAFRGMRWLQVVFVLAALATGVGGVLSLKAFSDEGGIVLLVVGILLGAAFFWLFSAALRAPTSFVAIADERTRIRYAGFVDTVIDNRDIISVRPRNWPIWGGIGVRTAFNGQVALVSAWGEAVELELRRPVRVWLIPGLVPVRARRLILSVRNPQKLVDRFGGAQPSGSSAPRKGGKVKNRGS